MKIQAKSIDKFVVIGDKILIRPQDASEKTSSGLYLPPGVSEKEKVQSGYVIKVGPGYPIPVQNEDEPWKDNEEQINYIPLQITEGDLAIFLRKDAYEINFESEKFIIVPQTSVLMVIREDDYLG
ncbi:MAG: chaperonin [Ignavibacteriales bacterium CG12_big_fil_rev_8_21_14_0_65_30_8]|nr:MAG: chaperonin [Ignavibacteriales bacterium CG12_big_fil_rev_8_21_14_0_65_30_8]